MNNGCPECEKLGRDERCLDCQLEEADHQVCVWMNIREELERKKWRKEHPVYVYSPK